MPRRCFSAGLLLVALEAAAAAALALEPSNRIGVSAGSALGALAGDFAPPKATNDSELVDFRILKTFLPEQAPGLRRTEVFGQRLGPLDMTITFAKAIYTNEHEATAEIKISDMSSIGGQIMLSAQANWAATDLDRETDTGYDKTLLIDGFKAREQYDFTEKAGDIQIVVDSRFLIEISCCALEPAAIKSLAALLDLKKLAATNRKPPARPPVPTAPAPVFSTTNSVAPPPEAAPTPVVEP